MTEVKLLLGETEGEQMTEEKIRGKRGGDVKEVQECVGEMPCRGFKWTE